MKNLPDCKNCISLCICKSLLTSYYDLNSSDKLDFLITFLRPQSNRCSYFYDYVFNRMCSTFSLQKSREIIDNILCSEKEKKNIDEKGKETY